MFLSVVLADPVFPGLKCRVVTCATFELSGPIGLCFRLPTTKSLGSSVSAVGRSLSLYPALLIEQVSVTLVRFRKLGRSEHPGCWALHTVGSTSAIGPRVALFPTLPTFGERCMACGQGLSHNTPVKDVEGRMMRSRPGRALNTSRPPPPDLAAIQIISSADSEYKK